MKLIIAIVQDEDAARLVSNLMNEGYSVTKLATTGGFLRAGNTTLLLGVDEEKFQGAMNVIEKVCKSRKQIATSPSPVAARRAYTFPTPSRSWWAARRCSCSTWSSSSSCKRWPLHFHKFMDNRACWRS